MVHIALHEELHAVAGGVVELGAQNVLIALVVLDGDQLRRHIVEPAFIVLEHRAESEVVRRIDRILHARGAQIEASVPVGGARLVVLETERPETGRMIAGAEHHEVIARERVTEIPIDMTAIVAVGADREGSIRILGEVLRNDVDGSRDPLGTVEKRLGAFENHDALDH